MASKLQGSVSNPIEIPPNTTYSGQVDTTKSYYKTWGESPGDNVGVRISELIDDPNLMEYNGDSTFTAHPTPRTSDMPFYGRTMPEWTNNGGYGTSDLYFVVDGSYSEAGTSFTITVTSMGGSLSIAHNEGSESDPVTFPSGYQDSASVATGTTSYYMVAVTPGVSYRANSYASGDINLSIYTDQFVTLAGGPSIHSGPVTATGNFLFIKAEPATTGYDFSMEVVRAEGGTSSPRTPIRGKDQLEPSRPNIQLLHLPDESRQQLHESGYSRNKRRDHGRDVQHYERRQSHNRPNR